MDTYNGWTNYATWRINLEMIDGMEPSDFIGHGCIAPSELKDAIKEYVESIIEESTAEGVGREYALAFVSDVDWWAIAEHLITQYEEV